MKRNLFLSISILGTIAAFGEIPSDYYSTLNGKSGDNLINAINALSKGHTRITYGGSNGKTWESFEKTDVRIFGGKQVWWDMYSNVLVYLPDRSGMNIEHSVANSWWGGDNATTGNRDAYADLFILNPSDQNANNQKSNWPVGTVSGTPAFDNGISKVGVPVSGQGGGATKVFEPADEYKGDFARAYFYTFTAYNDAKTWQSDSQYVYDENCRLKPWAVELLLKWHREDPVDTKEINRNEEIYKLQGNRNPFIDYPDLADYVWGEKSGQNVSMSSLVGGKAVDRPDTPVFDDAKVVGMNTYSTRWWDGFMQSISYNAGTLYISLDGRDYFIPSEAGYYFDPASDGESHTIKAYTVEERDGYTLRSSIATLTLTAQDPDKIEYTTARWEKLTADKSVTLEEEKWILLSWDTNAVMGTDRGQTSSTSFMNISGLADFSDDNSDDIVVEIPLESAVVEFDAVGNGKYRLMVYDVNGKYIGSWTNTSKDKMNLSTTTYSPGTWNITDDDKFVFTFDEYGSLQFNKSQPRFKHYSTNQGAVKAYRFMDMEGGTTGIEHIGETPWGVGIDGNDIIAPENSVIYDLNGRRVKGENLGHGIYIVVGSGKSVKVRL